MTYSEKKYKSEGISGQKISLGQKGNNLMTLIAICLVVFVGLAFMKAVWYFRYPKEEAPGYFNKDILSLFTLPADWHLAISRPWTLITHMFVHDNFWKIFPNMLWLWFFGYILQDRGANKKIIPVFVYGALGGALAFILAYNLLPSLNAVLPYAGTLGASAGVMALAIVTTMGSPGYRIFPLIGGGIPLWVLTACYIFSDLATIPFSDTGNLVAHVAGGVTGFLFIFFLRMGIDGSRWMNALFDRVDNLFNPDKPKKGKNRKEELLHKTGLVPDNNIPHLTQERVDEILDKINQQGYSSLSEEEKELLTRAANGEL